MIPMHPHYLDDQHNWLKYRLTFEGGWRFVQHYLQRYSERETLAEFAYRQKISYCPAHAKAAILEIKNSIFERMGDVARIGGPASYTNAVAGIEGGIDFTGRNMTSFIGMEIIPELLVMRRVGVFVDKDVLPEKRTRAEDAGIRPYLYVYKTEDILSWSYNRKNQLSSVLLRSHVDTIDENLGLVTGLEEEFKLLKLTDSGVSIQKIENGKASEPTILALNEIPFVIFEMKESLMTDIADYQIALLNLESSDMAYLIGSNFPFYTEQVNQLAEMSNVIRQGRVTTDADGNKIVTVGDDAQTAEVGSRRGRRYPKGLERPGFINPSPEPMNVSMAKQTDMRAAIRQLVQLALSNLSPTRASGESKQIDQHGLESGLAHIGLILETGENKIAKLWADYEDEDTALVAYPDKYSLTTDAERIAEADGLSKNLYKVPSITYQKILAKRIAALTVGRGINVEEEQKIVNEIDAAEIIAVDPEVLLKDMEAGLVCAETASKARGYPKGDVALAKEEHIARLSAIAIAQTKGGGAARGMPTGPMDDSAAEEKAASQSADNQPAAAGKATRGKA